MTAAVVDIVVPTRHTAEARGRGALRLLTRAGVPRQFLYRPPSDGPACWAFPAARLGDVVAASEVTRGVSVVVHDRQEALPI